MQQEKLNILVLTDQAGEAARFQPELAALGFATQFEEVRSAEALQAALRSQAFDLVLADCHWPNAVRVAREASPFTSVIGFSRGAEDPQLATRWIQAGALDFLFSRNGDSWTRAMARAANIKGQNELFTGNGQRFLSAYETLRSTVASCPIGICAVDEQGRVMLWTTELERITGWKQEEVLGKIPPTIPPEELDRFFAMLNDAVASGGPSWNKVEVPRRKKDGSSLTLSITNSPLHDKSGQIRGLVSMMTDITGRDELEAKAIKEQSELDAIRRYRDLLEAAPDAIVEVDENGKIVLANQGIRRLFGYEPDQLVGQSVDILVPDHLRSTHGERRRGYMHSPSIRPMGSGLKLSARRADGVNFPVEITLSPMQLSGSTHVAAAIRDITDRERLTAEAARNAEQARTLFEAYPVPAYVYDRETMRILAVNDKATR
jgi:PAS domain S-box-containing protein